MKHVIYPEYQGTITITAGTTNPNYPITNLTDNNYMKKVWKAVGTTATISVAVTASSGVVGIYNTNATSVTVNGTAYTGLTGRSNIWYEYTVSTDPIVIAFVASDPVEAGIVRAGALTTFVNPTPTVSEGRKSFSIKKELRNGAIYTKKLEIIKTYSYSMEVKRDIHVVPFLELYEYYDVNPMAILIADSVGTANKWTVFAAIESQSVSHNYPEHSTISVSLAEAV